MPVYALSTAVPCKDELFYLDSSALYPIAADAATNAKRTSPVAGATHIEAFTSDGATADVIASATAAINISKIDRQRVQLVSSFLNKVSAAGAKAKSTVLALEEIAALARNRAREKFAYSAQHGSWKDFKRNDPNAAAVEDSKAHNSMMLMLWGANVAIKQFGIAIEWPADNPPGDSPLPTKKSLSTTLPKAFRQLARKHNKIDAMDVLHIVMGTALGIHKFVSFDGGWETVAGIDVYRQ